MDPTRAVNRPERRLAGMEIPEPLQTSRGLCLPLGATQGQKTARSRSSLKEENPASLQVRWHRRSRLANVSAHGRNHAGGDGRTSTDDPRLPAAQHLHVTNKYLQATSKSKRSAQEKLVEAITPATGFLPKSTLVQGSQAAGTSLDVRFSLIVP